VRPATPVFAHGGDLPRHLADIRSQLSGGGSQAPPDAMGLPTVLEELAHVCASATSGRLLNNDDRLSLIADIGRSVSDVGSHAAAAAAPELADFRREVGRLNTRLQSAEGARAVALATTSLSAALRRPDVAVGAWRDVIATFEAQESSAESCEASVRSLRELTELRGHLWEPLGLASRLQTILSDDAVAQESERPATPIEQRLAPCEDTISTEPEIGDVAVWFAFANANLTTPYLQLGPLLFVVRDFVPEGFAQDRALEDLGRLPDLERWEDAEAHLSQLPGEHVVLARVWLPETFAEQAPSKARMVLESLLEIAKPGSTWRLYEGYMAWSGGEHFWGSSLMDAEEWERNSPAVSPFFEGTHRALTEFKPEFVQRLADQDASALEAVEDARWTIGLARAGDASQRVALGTRALERTLGVARARDESWLDVTTRFLKGPWVRLTFENELLDAAIAGTSGLPGRHTYNAEAYREIHDLVLPEHEPGIRIVSYAGVAGVQTRYGHLWEANALSLRVVREASAALTDPIATLEMLSRLEARFDRLIARTERQRNSLIHGTRPTQGVLTTIDGFVSTLNAYVAQESIRTAETGGTPLQQLEQWRVEALARRQRVETGENPLDVLFPDG
jgi:hypothetical protein